MYKIRRLEERSFLSFFLLYQIEEHIDNHCQNSYIFVSDHKTRCCTLRRAKNTPTRSFVSNLYISQHSLPENGSQANLKHRALHKSGSRCAVNLER
jgi:hypothetical protein